MTSGARSFTEKTAPNVTPMTFQPATHERFQKIHTLSSTAAKFSANTVGKVSTIAQNAGAKLAGKDQGYERNGSKNPGFLNKSLIAFSTVADSIDFASKTLLSSGSQAATQMVSHKYGQEAGTVAQSLTGSVKNVGLVYIDASGVSRRAVVKGVAKGMVVGQVKGGGEVVIPASMSGNGKEGGVQNPPPYEQGIFRGNGMYYGPPSGPPPGGEVARRPAGPEKGPQDYRF